MNIDQTIISKLTDEQKKKVEAVKTPEELLTLAKESGYELSPEQLDAIAGGRKWYEFCEKDCPTFCTGMCPVIGF